MNYQSLLCFSKCCVCVCVFVVILQLMEKSNPARKLASQVEQLVFGLEKVKALLKQRSPTVNEAQNVLKVCVSFGLCSLVCLCVNVT